MKLLPKTKDGRLNMLPIFGVIIVLFGGFILLRWLMEHELHGRWQREGRDIIAEIQNVIYYDSPGRRFRVRTYDINDADSLELRVRFVAEGRVYVTTLGSTFSLKRNDHAALQDAIVQDRVSVRYLPNDPTKVRFTLEFTDPDDNPYFGGK